MEQRVRIRNLILLAGSYCAYVMGAAFSSGREMLQYFVGFGIRGYLGLAFVAAVFILYSYLIMTASFRQRFQDPYDCFPYFCGERMGRIFIWLLTFNLVSVLIMMTASAGANLNQSLGLSENIGRGVILLAGATVCLGLSRIVDIISRLGPFLAMFIALVAVIAIFRGHLSISEGNEAVKHLEIYTGSGNLAISCFKFTFYCLLTNLPVLVVCGMNGSSMKELKVSSVTQILAFAFVCLLIITAQLKNIQDVYNLEIPNLMLVKLFIPSLSLPFSIVLLTCTYASATLMIWTIVRKFTKEKTRTYYILILVLTICVYFISSVMSFSHFLNLVSVLGLYMGGLFFLMVLRKTIMEMRSRA